MQASQFQTKLFDCQLCCEQRNTNDLITLNCEHKFCKKCIYEHLYVQKEILRDNFSFQNIKCLHSQCNKQPFAYFNVVPIFGKEETDKLIELGLSKKKITCPWCKKNFQPLDKYMNGLFELDFNQLPPQIECPNCKQDLCLKCKSKKHTLEKGCNLDVLLEFIHSNSDPWMVCPYCMTGYLKDENCQQVICENCNKKFCFSCGAPQDAISRHDNSYHRPDCPFFAQQRHPISKEIIYSRCIVCQDLPEHCPQPVSLKEFAKFYHLENKLIINKK